MDSVLVELIDRELLYRQSDGCAPASAPLSDNAGHVVAKLLLGSLVDCAVWLVVPQVRPLGNKFLAHLRCGCLAAFDHLGLLAFERSALLPKRCHFEA